MPQDNDTLVRVAKDAVWNCYTTPAFGPANGHIGTWERIVPDHVFQAIGLDREELDLIFRQRPDRDYIVSIDWAGWLRLAALTRKVIRVFRLTDDFDNPREPILVIEICPDLSYNLGMEFLDKIGIPLHKAVREVDEARAKLWGRAEFQTT